jgi:nucleotide-binding universal stress UspA family protein
LQNVESDRADHQRDLLAAAREFAEEMDVHLRTRAVVAPDVGEAILDVLAEEEADEVLLGWDGTLGRDEDTFGPTLDALVVNAPCDVSLVALSGERVGRPVALVTPGPNAAAVARRAAEFATVDGTVPMLLTVRPSRNDDSDAAQQGAAIVEEIADAADLDPSEYEIQVVVDDDAEAAIRERIDRYDTVCVGLSQRSDRSGIPFGPITDGVVRDTRGNVALIRGT